MATGHKLPEIHFFGLHFCSKQ